MKFHKYICIPFPFPYFQQFQVIILYINHLCFWKDSIKPAEKAIFSIRLLVPEDNFSIAEALQTLTSGGDL